jgi:hypothetical protein
VVRGYRRSRNPMISVAPAVLEHMFFEVGVPVAQPLSSVEVDELACPRQPKHEANLSFYSQVIFPPPSATCFWITRSSPGIARNC